MKLMIDSNDLECTLRQELGRVYVDAEIVLQHVRNCCDEVDTHAAIQRVDAVLDQYEIKRKHPNNYVDTMSITPNERGQLLGMLVRAALGLAITPKVDVLKSDPIAVAGEDVKPGDQIVAWKLDIDPESEWRYIKSSRVKCIEPSRGRDPDRRVALCDDGDRYTLSGYAFKVVR